MEALLAYLDKKDSKSAVANDCNIVIEGENANDNQEGGIRGVVLDLEWEEEDFSSNFLSDEDVNQYLREINQSSASTDNNNKKELKDWTDSELMVFLAFNQIPQEIVLKLFEKQIRGDYFVGCNDAESKIIGQEQLMRDCAIDEDIALEIIKLLTNIGVQ